MHKTMPWEEAINELFGNFFLRNSMEKWHEFIDEYMPEDEYIFRQLRGDIWKRIFKIGNIRQAIVVYLESVFNFTNSLFELEFQYGPWHATMYKHRYLGKPEIPSFEKFDFTEGDFSAEDYDRYVDLFEEAYFSDYDNILDFAEILQKIRDTGIRHPDIGLLLAEYYTWEGDLIKAASSLEQVDEGYYKSVILGEILFQLDEYERCLQVLEPLLADYGSAVDPVSCNQIFMSKWALNQKIEAMVFAGEYLHKGDKGQFSSNVKAALKSHYDRLKRRMDNEFTEEWELILALEYLSLSSSFNEIFALCEEGEKKGFESNVFYLFFAESAFELGNYETVNEIIDKMETRVDLLTEWESVRLDVIRARELFRNRDVEQAYSLMEKIKYDPYADLRHIEILAEMNMITGRYSQALVLYGRLREASRRSLKYSMLWCEAMRELGGEDDVINHLKDFLEVYTDDPEFFKDATEEMIHSCQMMLARLMADNDIEGTEELIGILEESESVEYWQIQMLRGLLAESRFDAETAENLYRAAIESVSGSSNGTSVMAELYGRLYSVMQDNDYSDEHLIDEGWRIIGMVPEAEMVWEDLARRLKVKDAICCLEKGLQYCPFSYDLHWDLAVLYVSTWDYAKARYHYEINILNTRMSYAYYDGALFALKIEDLEWLQELISKLYSFPNWENEARSLKAKLLMKKGEYSEAQKLFDGIILNSDGGDPDSEDYEQSAYCMCKNGQIERAITFLADASKEYESLLDELYRIQIKTGDYDGAYDTAEKMRSSNSEYYSEEDYLQHICELALVKGETERGVEFTEHLTTIHGKMLRAIALFLNGQHRESIALLEKQVSDDIANLQIYKYLSLFLLLSGRSEKAAEYARRELSKRGSAHGYNGIDLSDKCDLAMFKIIAGDDDSGALIEEIMDSKVCIDSNCTGCQDGYFAKGLFMALNGRIEEAKDALQKAMHHDKSDAVYMYVYDLVCEGFFTDCKKPNTAECQNP